jgi:endonuclease G
MRKILITFLLIFTAGYVSAQIPKDTITLKHSGYTTLWSSTLDYPLLVQWWDTKERCACATPIPRKDQFAADPLLIKETNIQFEYEAANKSQRDKGLKVFDRGHMSPAADNQCSITDKGKKIPAETLQKESFYFTNMAPQYHSLNAGDWKKLEERTRELASANDSIYVWCGSVGTQMTLSGLAIPTKCWKVIYIKKTKTYECYIFNNTPDKPVGLDKWKVTKEEVEKLTGFKFNL